VAERMRRDAALLEGWKLSGRPADHLLKVVGSAGTGEPLPVAIGEDRSFRRGSVFLDPSTQSGLGFTPQG
jgi:hypothetical protein